MAPTVPAGWPHNLTHPQMSSSIANSPARSEHWKSPSSTQPAVINLPSISQQPSASGAMFIVSKRQQSHPRTASQSMQMPGSSAAGLHQAHRESGHLPLDFKRTGRHCFATWRYQMTINRIHIMRRCDFSLLTGFFWLIVQNQAIDRARAVKKKRFAKKSLGASSIRMGFFPSS